MRDWEAEFPDPSCRKLTKESSLRANSAGLLISQNLLVSLKRGESDSHLWDNAGHDGAESLVQTKRGLALNDLCSSADETTGLDLWVVLEMNLMISPLSVSWCCRWCGGLRTVGKVHKADLLAVVIGSVGKK